MPTKEELSAIRRENLSSLIDERYDGVQARLATVIGKPSNYVWRLLTAGPHAKGIGEEIARLIEDRLGLEPYALDRPAGRRGRDTGQRTMSPAPAASEGPRSISVVQASAVDGNHGKITAGWVQRHAVAEVYVAAEYSASAYAIPVPDSSMEPNFLPGEMLIFDPEVAPEAGDYVLARVRSGILFRRYRPGAGGAFMLDAMSESFAPVWSDRDSITILGVLVEHHRTRAARKPLHN